MKNYLKTLGIHAAYINGLAIYTTHKLNEKERQYIKNIGFDQFVNKFAKNIKNPYQAITWLYYFAYFDYDVNKTFTSFKEEFDTLNDDDKDKVLLTIYGEPSLSDHMLIDIDCTPKWLHKMYDQIDMNNYKKFLLKCMLLDWPLEACIILNNLKNINCYDLLNNDHKLLFLNNSLRDILNSEFEDDRFLNIYDDIIYFLNKYQNVELSPDIQKLLKEFLFSLSRKRKYMEQQIFFIKTVIPRLSFDEKEQKKLLKFEAKKLIKSF